ncbi:MAG: hypothetical protein KDD82_03235 [Planctomycetes bacterium]|nr:hypothetical protein [Planctomycetota bacterium]
MNRSVRPSLHGLSAPARHVAKMRIETASLSPAWKVRSSKWYRISFDHPLLAEAFDARFPRLRSTPWSKIEGRNGPFGARAELGLSGLGRHDEIDAFLELLRGRVIVSDQTSGSLSLSWHYISGSRSPVGQLLNQAKLYGTQRLNDEAQRAAQDLAQEMVQAFGDFRWFFAGVDAVLAVPRSDPNKADLPGFIAGELAHAHQLADLRATVTKLRRTRSIKTLPMEQKIVELDGSIGVESPYLISGRAILIVDDLYQSGTTINFIAELLKTYGAREVYGFTATKTSSHTDNQGRG